MDRADLPLVERAATLVPAPELERRVAALQASLAARDLDAALLLQNADLYYFAGTVQQSYLYVPVTGEPTLFVRKVVERARLESALGGVVPLVSATDLPRALAERYGGVPARVGLELDVLPVARYRALADLFPAAAFEDVGRDIVRLRAVKSPWEADRIRASAALADAVAGLIPGILRPGLTEVEFAGRVEAEARRLGHEGYIRMRGFNQEIFYGQTLSGASGAVPTYLDTPLGGTGLSPAVAQGPSFRRIGRGDPVLFDFVPVRDGYLADFTRSFCLGDPPDRVRRAHEAALDVQEAVAGALRPGASCREVWETAREAATAAGLQQQFMGAGDARVPYVGHGIGLELDELPVLTGSGLTLQEGMVVAVEPKFVLSGLGAVGLENTWLVTSDAAERLTLAPDALVVVG